MSDNYDLVANILCGKPLDFSIEKCFKTNGSNKGLCSNKKCRVLEKSTEQIDYIIHQPPDNIFLEACAGSGKTEVVGLKAAYEIKKWTSKYSGIAILTFTNNAADIIKERISETTQLRYPHYVGTLDSWLHRYIANPFSFKVTKYQGKAGDRSLRIVDNRSVADFLKAFQIKNFYTNPVIKAHEFYFTATEDSIIFSSGDPIVDRSREQLTLVKAQKEELRKLKYLFWEKGFATYQDVEYICYKLLEKYSAEITSKRFPVIFIDECQDLAYTQIRILEKLLEKGTKIHLIGDLNQAIYSFRKVNPEDVDDFVHRHNLTKMRLSRNYRSLQPIVDLSSRIVNQSKIVGVKPSTDDPVCFYLEYKKECIHELPNKFIRYLQENNFIIDECAILTRNNNTVAKLRPGVSSDVKASVLLPVAINIWNCKNISSDQISDALSVIGKFVVTYYFNNQSSNSKSQYCPEEITSNMHWRLFLANILDECHDNHLLKNFEIDWSEWAKHFRSSFQEIIVRLAKKHNIALDIEKSKEFRAPPGKAKSKVSETIETTHKDPSIPIRITNFHQVKGETLDAAMVVSSPTNQGQGEGFWKNWLSGPKSEGARFAYVASTRPRNLLIWALPEKLDSNDVLLLSKLGFTLLPEV